MGAVDLGLEGRVALITGSSAGIGFTTAEVLAREGATVVLCSRDHQRVNDASLLLGRTVGIDPPVAVVADMASSDGPARAVQAALDAHGRLDILVNNASDSEVGPLLALDPHDVERLFRAKPIGYVLACLAAVPAMRSGGVIVNVAGISSKSVSPSSVTTVATMAVIGLTKALSEEVAHLGIRVLAVSPGPIRTPHLEENFVRFASFGGSTPHAVEEDMIRQVPLGRLGESLDVAEAIAFLASDRASYITGTALVVDGGKSRAIN
jgi:3-oxoacyl-[acyl-carrier protein] reductase/bacilysin biosynthesis oxidoreductase BacG